MSARSYLLDTHVVIWMDREQARISAELEATLNASGGLYVSAASAWEIAIKRATGKMSLTAPLSEALRRLRLNELAITVAHGEFAGALPPHHGDPFDRVIVAQARLEGLVLVTNDKLLESYDVELLLV